MEPLLKQLRGEDFIVDPAVVPVLQRYLDGGGDTAEAIEALAGGYCGKAQMINTLTLWLRDLGGKDEVAECLEGSMQMQILRHFDADKADALFQSDATSADWLKGFIQHPRWRKVIYQLVERHPGSVFLAYAMKLIADAGMAHEIGGGKMTATQQLEVFTRVFSSELEWTLEALARGEDASEEEMREAMGNLASMMSQNEQSFIYASAIMERIVGEGEDKMCSLATSIIEGVRECLRGSQREQEMVTLRTAMKMRAECEVPPHVRASLLTMIVKRRVTGGDIDNVYQQYIMPRPPPVALIREKMFVRLLLDVVFAREQQQCHDSDVKQRAIFLLAYSATVHEEKNKGKRALCSLTLESSRAALEAAATVLEGSLEEIHRDISELLRLTMHPIVAAGCLWFYRSVLLSEGTRLGEIQTYIHVIFDHCAAKHARLHPTCLEILDEIYEKVAHEDDQAEVIMARQRVVVDRLVLLFTSGAPIRVLQRMTKKFEDGAIDASLIRYFVLEVLDVIGPPYSLGLARLLVPLVNNDSIIDEVQRVKLSVIGLFLADAQPVLDAAEEEEEEEEED